MTDDFGLKTTVIFVFSLSLCRLWDTLEQQRPGPIVQPDAKHCCTYTPHTRPPSHVGAAFPRTAPLLAPYLTFPILVPFPVEIPVKV